MANNGPTFTRLGPGDLPGDPNHPNSPDYVEPAYGMEEAAEYVVADLLASDEASEPLCYLIESAAALRWIAENVNLPTYMPNHRAPFQRLLEQAERLEKLTQDEYDELNAQEDDDA